MFQDPLTSLNPLYTIGRQLDRDDPHALAAFARPTRARARSALLDEVGIPGAARRIDQYPHQFSGGMRQRVVIALALAANPRLIVADEPTTALDVSIQAQIIQLLKRLCRDHGTAVMLVTHDMGVIAETADRVAVMYAGRIVEIGPVADVIHRPAHPYTIGLMGSIPSIVDERERLTQIDGAMPRLDGRSRRLRIPSALSARVRALLARAAGLEPVGATHAACWRAQVPRAMRRDERRRAVPWRECAGGQRSRPQRGGAPIGRGVQVSAAQADDVARTFDVSPPWLNRVLERGPRALLKAVDGVELAIARGETLGLVGESGCGKSTVARLIVGLYAPTRGTIAYDGIAHCRRRRGGAGCAGERRAGRGMQMIFQDPYASLNPRWRVADIVAEPIARRQPGKPRPRSTRAWRRCSRRSASPPPTAPSIRTSSPAASASAFRSRGRCRRSPRSSSATSRRPRSTCRCRRRC